MSQEEVLKKLKEKDKKGQVDFLNVFRKLYNSMCRNCQLRVVAAIQKRTNQEEKASFEDCWDNMCNFCRKRARHFIEEANNKL